MNTWLLKPGELTLKGKNRKNFETVLKRNLQKMLSSTDARLEITNGRFYVRSNESPCEKIEEILDRLIGISGWAKTRICAKTIDEVIKTCIEEAKELFLRGYKSFKIEARRTDKSFPLDSYGLRRECGGAILEAVPGMVVNVQKPDGIIYIEIREKAYVYSNSRKGLGGLPVGTAGRGLLLLSGGIDSPVAGFRMSCRGMGIDAVHYHSYPYTSAEARQKVIDLAEILAYYCLGIDLYIVSFTKIQMHIKEHSPLDWHTVLLRMAMMECAEKIAIRSKNKCLITGESLSQVASQTIENISCTESRIKIPILRPLIGDDKISIIRQAEKIGTYKTSILPYEDCCVLFSSPHPILHGDIQEAASLYEALELTELMDEAFQSMEKLKIGDREKN